MAQILVRDVEEQVKKRLQRRAAAHGRSMEAEVRDILRDAVKHDELDRGLGTDIAKLFVGIGLSKGEKISELRGSTIRNPFRK